MFYGNYSNGYSHSPDRRNDKVNHFNKKSTFINANGNRQYGYYASNYSNPTTTTKKGHYLGNGQYVED